MTHEAFGSLVGWIVFTAIGVLAMVVLYWIIRSAIRDAIAGLERDHKPESDS